jgi:cell division protein FtsL
VFWCFTAGLLSVLLLGLVALNALLIQTTYRVQDVQQQVRDLADHQVRLSNDAAELSSPKRVADWAASQGMAMPRPGDTVILRVPGVASVPEGDAG